MFRKIGYALSQFMSGRCGTDQLNWALLLIGFLLEILGSVLDIPVLTILAYIPFIFMIFRIFSRNLEKRNRENAWFLGIFHRIKDREHRYFSCPKCRQRVRVPKGKGKISIRCPQCGERFVKKT